MLKYLVISVLAIGVMSVAVRVSTNALFTDSQAVGSNTFTTGSLDLSAQKTSDSLTLSSMAPGDAVVAPIDVTNTGSLALRYAVVSTTTEDALAGELQLTVKSGVNHCDSEHFTNEGEGTTLYSGELGSTSGVDVIGDPVQGPQTGDRTLAAGSDETLCFQVALPLSATNTYQGKSTTANFDFVAEQTANNNT